ncbi:hypothetical protein BASA50_005096 [Batrachochytrium salamandrivorans]|uniref:Uncharacterized protein n=1 Tax=Batrachochytrium salamandrivorans TaxID=1357716 RepID=A0ABQ8FGN5_9FUNG|nr:hypothetical protein BASA62_002186 [Batrachochytrium salamandrivorans]KAH6584928.1 hypothetical protein BASA61_007148 [Batrachochytrium salamandrivorans]KAH6596390.1 hypothetical protein BASA50_005096 [Batrachochytrium salamandrivorans]KAH9265440.1 hypothetical protein BASA84_001713 [Batrachochytrium salamandrivorans]KAH9275625.1 hypothetical protein BASA83_001913 [Batrachochytrium salamandrivorans]
MKLSSFFVAAMVITSANAVWLGEPEEEDISPQITEQSVTSSLEPSPDPDSMSNAVQKQMDDYSVISYMFNGDEEHDDLLKNMLKIQEKLFSAVDQSKTESRKNIGPTEIEEHPIQTTVEDDSIQKELAEKFGSTKFSFDKAKDLRSKMYGCLDRFEELELKYINEYGSLPEDCPILGFKELKEIAIKTKQDLKLNRRRSRLRSHRIQKS